MFTLHTYFSITDMIMGSRTVKLKWYTNAYLFKPQHRGISIRQHTTFKHNLRQFLISCKAYEASCNGNWGPSTARASARAFYIPPPREQRDPERTGYELSICPGIHEGRRGHMAENAPNYVVRVRNSRVSIHVGQEPVQLAFTYSHKESQNDQSSSSMRQAYLQCLVGNARRKCNSIRIWQSEGWNRARGKQMNQNDEQSELNHRRIFESGEKRREGNEDIPGINGRKTTSRNTKVTYRDQITPIGQMRGIWKYWKRRRNREAGPWINMPL
ncbi:uncharacterized protein MELLADRAFT_103230 [Melampsora larici-populina 98AG31]|uniref:Uncharacterized protein n=1 Tax=Melampsora larici-populina (strain 98AG31 / pathotype 3-4-7) TaxID=747676 RepID=F4RAZ4_MELLP|nr:uncharacterized protein MELLADRAFT_103230 [Melampsora larici-populina 98AG31]EGG10561.1 hypothetical protein MELLADRAFT_103230 [Melampsora larici-populina 98AG31]